MAHLFISPGHWCLTTTWCILCPCNPLYLLQLQAFSHLLSAFQQYTPYYFAVKALHSCLFSAYYNPSPISCLLPPSATLYPPISPPHSPLKLSGHATPPARAADQVTLNICHIMSHGLLCNFSDWLGLQMDYCAVPSVFYCYSAKRLVKEWGVLLHAFEWGYTTLCFCSFDTTAWEFVSVPC